MFFVTLFHFNVNLQKHFINPQNRSHLCVCHFRYINLIISCLCFPSLFIIFKPFLNNSSAINLFYLCQQVFYYISTAKQHFCEVIKASAVYLFYIHGTYAVACVFLRQKDANLCSVNDP